MKILKHYLTVITLSVGIMLTSIIPLVNAEEGTIILKPTDDAYTNGWKPDENYGASVKLKTIGFYVTWLKFDLSTMPKEAFGITAILELYTTNDEVYPNDVPTYLCPNTTWTEETITASNQPDLIEFVELDRDYISNEERWYEWLVTDAVTNATANNATAVTILMRTFGLVTPTISFSSKEGSLTKQPKLTISWEGVIPEFPTWLILPLFMMATLLIVAYQKTPLSKSRD